MINDPSLKPSTGPFDFWKTNKAHQRFLMNSEDISNPEYIKTLGNQNPVNRLIPNRNEEAFWGFYGSRI